MTCDCQGPGCRCGDEEPVANAPGLSALRWRAAPHGAALRRMRRTLPAPGADDPAAVLLDAWAVVTDVVSFYTERIAQEGFLRTATEGLSVRELARTIGYETRPGVAARTELTLDVEEASGAPATVHVPAGSPVRTIPAPDALPQVFETSAELEAVAAWNAVPALATVPQPLGWSVTDVWLPTLTPGVQVDDRLLVVGAERAGVGPGDPHGPDTERWDLRRVTAVEVAPAAHPGWTRIRLDRRIGFRASTPLVAEDDVQVFRLARRLALFGHDAPDPQMFSADFRPPRVPSGDDWSGLAANSVGPRLVELAGDHPDVVPGSWLVLEQPGLTEAYRVEDATPDGDKRFGLSGRITRLRLDIDENLAGFDRRQTVVHAVSRPLSAAVMPRFDPVGAAPGSSATVLDVAGTTPPLPAGRLVAVTGRSTTGAPGVETAVVVASTALPGGGQRLVLDPALTQAYDAGTVVVRANLVPATHGETVHQVLGSGDGRVAFPRFRLRRGPLTHVRSTTAADGAVADLTVLVEDVAWREVPSLLDAGPHDQVYVLRLDAEGLGTVTFGDGTHGARLPSGTENVRAVYRVGIGPDGAAGTGQVSLPVRRPRGIGTVANLAPARDWAGPEDLGQARVNAPQRIRTLDRAVSVADHADFARAYSGVGRARADLVWDGRADRVVVSVLAADGGPASGALITDLRSTLEDARDRRTPWTVVAGEVVDVAAKLTLDVDPRHERDAVRDAVTAALLDTFGGLDLGAPLAASAVLVAATSVDGVLSATMPVLRGPVGDDALLTAEPARWDTGTRTVRPARALRLVPGLLDVGVRT